METKVFPLYNNYKYRYLYMTKSEIILRLEGLFEKPAKKLHEKVGGSRPNIWKWWTEADRTSKKIESAALELIDEGVKAKEALEAAGVETVKL